MTVSEGAPPVHRNPLIRAQDTEKTLIEDLEHAIR